MPMPDNIDLGHEDADSINTVLNDQTEMSPSSTNSSSEAGTLDSLGEPYEYCPFPDSITFITYHYDSNRSSSESDADNENDSTDDEGDDREQHTPEQQTSPATSDNNHANTDSTHSDDSPATPTGSDTTEPGSCNCIPRCNDSQDSLDEVTSEERASLVAIANINDYNLHLAGAEERCALLTVRGITPLPPLTNASSQTDPQLISNLPLQARRRGVEAGIVDTSDCPVMTHELVGRYNHPVRALTDVEIIEDMTERERLFNYMFPLSPNDSAERGWSEWSDPDQDKSPHAGYTAPPPSVNDTSYSNQTGEESDDSADTIPLFFELPNRNGTILNGTWLDATEIQSLPPPPSPSLLDPNDFINVTLEITVDDAHSDDSREEVTEAEIADAREVVRQYYDEENKAMYTNETRDRNEQEKRQLSVACGTTGERVSRKPVITESLPCYTTYEATCNQALDQLNSLQQTDSQLNTEPSYRKRHLSLEDKSTHTTSLDVSTNKRFRELDNDPPQLNILQEYAKASALAQYSIEQIRNRRRPGFERPPTLSPKSTERQIATATAAALKQLQDTFHTRKMSDEPSSPEPDIVNIPTTDDELDETSPHDDDDKLDKLTNEDIYLNEDDWQD